MRLITSDAIKRVPMQCTEEGWHSPNFDCCARLPWFDRSHTSSRVSSCRPSNGFSSPVRSLAGHSLHQNLRAPAHLEISTHQVVAISTFPKDRTDLLHR